MMLYETVTEVQDREAAELGLNGAGELVPCVVNLDLVVMARQDDEAGTTLTFIGGDDIRIEEPYELFLEAWKSHADGASG